MGKMIRLLLGRLLLVLLAAGVGPHPALASRSGPRQESQALPSLTASNLYCYQPSKDRGDCYINWRAINGSTTAPAYANALTIEIDGKLRLKMVGVFDTAFTLENAMIGQGLKVTCGLPGSGGLADAGETYPYQIRATYSDDSYNYSTGQVTCPSYKGLIYLPLILRQ